MAALATDSAAVSSFRCLERSSRRILTPGPEAAKKAAISTVMVEWGEDDPDNPHVLGIVKGDVEDVEWNDLDD